MKSFFFLFDQERLKKLSWIGVILALVKPKPNKPEKTTSFTINVHVDPDANYYPPSETFDRRIYKALRAHKKHPNIDLEHTSKEELERYVRETNDATFHFSGNCELLADLLMYNFLNQEGSFLSAGNIYPPWKGASTIHRQLLGQYLSGYHASDDETKSNAIEEKKCPLANMKSHSINQLEKRIISCHHQTNEVLFKISASGYAVQIFGEIGHVFNALILNDEQDNPYVQFLDSWSTTNPLPTKHDLNKKFKSKKAVFSFEFCPNKELLSHISFENSRGVIIKALGHEYMAKSSKSL
ncbi:MAG: T3SS effector cysteine hydrolase SpvD family protein [Gammaproteobacteria bacterium]|nr:T3SS effector cysteine hydrolase SpvD family protein [Gammaproteobacteria bacterium]